MSWPLHVVICGAPADTAPVRPVALLDKLRDQVPSCVFARGTTSIVAEIKRSFKLGAEVLLLSAECDVRGYLTTIPAPGYPFDAVVAGEPLDLRGVFADGRLPYCLLRPTVGGNLLLEQLAMVGADHKPFWHSLASVLRVSGSQRGLIATFVLPAGIVSRYVIMPRTNPELPPETHKHCLGAVLTQVDGSEAQLAKALWQDITLPYGVTQYVWHTDIDDVQPSGLWDAESAIQFVLVMPAECKMVHWLGCVTGIADMVVLDKSDRIIMFDVRGSHGKALLRAWCTRPAGQSAEQFASEHTEHSVCIKAHIPDKLLAELFICV